MCTTHNVFTVCIFMIYIYIYIYTPRYIRTKYITVFSFNKYTSIITVYPCSPSKPQECSIFVRMCTPIYLYKYTSIFTSQFTSSYIHVYPNIIHTHTLHYIHMHTFQYICTQYIPIYHNVFTVCQYTTTFTVYASIYRNIFTGYYFEYEYSQANVP